ncbi:hypothetical protein [Mesobacillus jeotgali]|uniref:hypothetical protein n=1 Tax=Mesobacillus jeotgali TaxID=129985 RepID=UPI0009A83365|nr:hypothetical protein [Mesobacillus jeotgali]
MLDTRLMEELQQYIERNLIYAVCEKSMGPIEDYVLESISPLEIESFIAEKRKPTLQKVLFGFIDKKGAKDAEIYKKAGIDRKLFSKIRSSQEYRPSKNTIIALALALELTKKETDKLLSSGGYSLSDSETSDLVIQFCIERNIYDLQQVNYALEYFSQKLLGGVL